MELNPCAAQWFVSIFHSLKTRIADTISRAFFLIIYEIKLHVLDKPTITNNLINFNGIFGGLNIYGYTDIYSPSSTRVKPVWGHNTMFSDPMLL